MIRWALDQAFIEAIAGVKPIARQELTQPIYSSLVRNTGRIMCFIEYLKNNLHIA